MDAQDAVFRVATDSAESTPIWSSELSELLFDRMPMGIAILDRHLHIQRYNPTWYDFSLRYAPPSGVPLTPGVAYFDHLPGSEAIVMPLFERALAGEVVRARDVRLESDGVVTYWDVVLAPLHVDDDTVGILNVAVDVTERVQLRRTLELRVRERTRELQVLLDVSAAANNSLDLQETLDKTLDLIVALVGAARAGVVLADEQTGKLRPFSLRPEQPIAPDDLATILAVCRSVIATGQMLAVVPDPARGLREPGALVPLQTRSSCFGVLAIIGAEGTVFSPAQLALFQSIAEQLSVAIENASLFAQAEQAAISAERNRLARDLHDAVTQTLFSAGMIAEVLPKIWERNPDEGRRRLDELRRLTRGALSEMRTLLVELRPTALVDTDLGDLVGHQINAFGARTGVAVAYARDGSHNPPPEVKEAFYRIAQEAFNNIAKHAEPTQVNVALRLAPGRAELEIRDDGLGFDAHADHHEGLGLGIMRERAAQAGAVLTIESRPRAGTRLRLTWQPPKEEDDE